MDKFRLHKSLTKKEYAALLRKVCEQVPVGIGVMDTRGRWLVTNAKMAKYIPKGAPSAFPESAIHWRAYDEKGHLIHRKDWPGQRALRGEIIKGMEMIFTDKNGRDHWMRVSAAPLRDPKRLLGAISVIQNIEEIKKVEEAKDDFISLLSHELRNPLAAVITGMELLKFEIGRIPEAFLRRRVSNILSGPTALMGHQINTMAQLINDLLDVSRAIHGKIAVKKELIELNAIVRNAIATCKMDIDAAGHKLAVIMPKKPYKINGDPIRLEQVVVNLLKNAIRYTPKRGHIRISLSAGGGNAIIRVKDDGMGIDKEKMREIFRPYSQVAKPKSGSYVGLGLGLPLVLNICELHGGSVQARSGGIGRGSEFIVRLPLASNVIKNFHKTLVHK